MKKILGLILMGLFLTGMAEVTAGSPTTLPVGSPVVETVYPGLASGSLTYAKLGKLPDGVLVRAGNVTITAPELQKQVDKAPEIMREQYKKNMFFLLEQETAVRLMLGLAKMEFSRTKTNSNGQTDSEMIDKFIENTIVAKVSVSETQVADYYKQNREMFGTATFGEIKGELREYVLQEKQQKALGDYIRNLGKQVPIMISASWVKEQAKLTMDNPVDRARTSGKPTMVDFGSAGCIPCKMMAPILEALKQKYAGKVNVVYVDVQQENILAERYGVQPIPIQMFFDKTGKEIFRHPGFFPQEQIELKLREMGVK